MTATASAALIKRAACVTDAAQHVIPRCDLRSRWRTSRLRAVVERDRQEIPRRVRRCLPWGVSPERAWRELPAGGGILQENVWSFSAYCRIDAAPGRDR